MARSNMENTEVLSYTVAFLAIWKCYSFVWAILILFTVWLVILTTRTSSKADLSAKISSRVCRNQSTRGNDNLIPESDLDSTSTGRTFRSISRRYVNADSAKHDLPFTDLLMKKNVSSRQGTYLRSPEPLISQVTRHLSFSNDSYYPDRTRTKGITQQHNSRLNTAKFNSSYLLSPVNSPDNSQGNVSSYQKPYFAMPSSPLQERYSPRCFSVINPTFSMPECPSTVKINQQSDNVDGSPLAYESVLQKRLQRTKENPCSRHVVLSALVQKSRKRPAVEVDGSFLEPTYSVKKRRRDELDDFLDSVADPLSSCAKVSSSIVKPVKRPYLHSDNETNFSLTRADKRSRQRQRFPEDNTSASTNKLIQSCNESNDEFGNTSNKMANSAGGITADSGVVLNVSDDTSVEPVKPKKGKSVTFSQDTGSKTLGIRDKVPRNRAYSEVNKNMKEKQQSTEDEGAISEKENSKLLPIFQARFSPRKPLHSFRKSPSDKAKKKTQRLKSSLTWKDFQENRREAWRRSQKLLDDIEESLTKERGEPSGLHAVSSSVGLTAATISGISKSALNSINVNLNRQDAGKTQGLPVTSLPSTTSMFTSTNMNLTVTSKTDTTQKTMQPIQDKSGAGRLVNFIGYIPKSESSVQGAGTRTTTKTMLQTRNPGITTSSNSSGAKTLNSITSFGNNPSGITYGVVPSTTSSTAVAPHSITGVNATCDFTFAVPTNPVKAVTNTSVSLVTTTTLNKPSVANAVAPSSASPFTGFGSSTTSSTASQQTVTNTSTFSVNSASSGLTPFVTPQTTSLKPTFGFPSHTGSITSTGIPQTITSQSAFSFQAPSAHNPSTNFPPTTTSLSTFTFQAPALGNSSQPPTQPSLPSQNKPTGVFNFAAGSSSASIFGGAGLQASTTPGFNFTSQKNPTFGNQGGAFTNVGSTNVASTADQSKPVAGETGGFRFTAPAVNERNTSGGFNFGQTTSGTFNFGSPPPAVGGFSFGGTATGPGALFLSSTPMPGISGGISNGTFTLGSSGRGETTASRRKPPRRRR